MDFWKRLNLIGCAIAIVLWLAVVAASSWYGDAPKAPACITNCL